MRRTRSVGLAVLASAVAALVAGCADPAPERVVIAGDRTETGIGFELAGPGGAALLVPVHVNGEGPFSFVLDTGAPMTCIDGALADRLALPEAAGQAVGVGVGQEPGALRLVAMDSVRIGEATAVGLTGCALDLGGFRDMGLAVEGLLGLSYLEEFVVTLDFPSRRLTLERRGES
jgi:predicted aspartyl protease